MTDLFSQRTAPPPSALRYDVPSLFRDRFIAILDHCLTDHRDFSVFLNEMEDLLCRRYGCLRSPSYIAARRSDYPVIDHFYYCNDDQALDFIEACFHMSVSMGGQDAVDEINMAFRQEGLGYELTQFNFTQPSPRDLSRGGRTSKIKFPQINRVDHQHSHSCIVAPALSVLATSDFDVANKEMLQAFSHHRVGRHEDAITVCCSAFESVLKTICINKGWDCDPDRDTCSRLIDVCHKNCLFPSFYVELFKRMGTIRNKLGDAHGRGPVQQHDVKQLHAEHFLNMACTHILFLCDVSGVH